MLQYGFGGATAHFGCTVARARRAADKEHHDFNLLVIRKMVGKLSKSADK